MGNALVIIGWTILVGLGVAGYIAAAWWRGEREQESHDLYMERMKALMQVVKELSKAQPETAAYYPSRIVDRKAVPGKPVENAGQSGLVARVKAKADLESAVITALKEQGIEMPEGWQA